MQTPSIKIPKLRDSTPSKLTISVVPELMSDLETYAKIYEQSYGDKQPVTSLIPFMLAGFMASDSGFKKAKRDLA